MTTSDSIQKAIDTLVDERNSLLKQASDADTRANSFNVETRLHIEFCRGNASGIDRAIAMLNSLQDEIA